MKKRNFVVLPFMALMLASCSSKIKISLTPDFYQPNNMTVMFTEGKTATYSVIKVDFFYTETFDDKQITPSMFTANYQKGSIFVDGYHVTTDIEHPIITKTSSTYTLKGSATTEVPYLYVGFEGTIDLNSTFKFNDVTLVPYDSVDSKL